MDVPLLRTRLEQAAVDVRHAPEPVPARGEGGHGSRVLPGSAMTAAVNLAAG